MFEKKQAAFAFSSLLVGYAAVSLAQVGISFECPDHECHVAPYFNGEGGFVGILDEDFEEASFAVSCGATLTTGTLSPNDDDIVVQLFSHDNGFACDQDDGSLEVHGLDIYEGNWYWITDDRSSAVAYLLVKDVLENFPIEPVDPETSDITFTTLADDLGTYIKQRSTGRVGILPHFVPEPEPEVCGPYWSRSREVYLQDDEDCMVGDGEAEIRLSLYDSITAERNTIRDGEVIRPVSGSIDVAMELFSNESGSIAYDEMPPELGWHLSRSRKSLYVSFDIEVVNAAPGADDDDALMEAGIEILDSSIRDDDSDGLAWIRISASDTYCTSAESYVAKLLFQADPSSQNTLLPEIVEDDDGYADETTLDVICPPRAPAAGAGRDLVPHNPFPADSRKR